jgi:hypothetical protein
MTDKALNRIADAIMVAGIMLWAAIILHGCITAAN